MQGGHPGDTQNLTRKEVPEYFNRRLPLERVLAMALLVPASPVILLLAVVVRVTSHGPAIYRQQRVGKDGRNFEIYKLRTMIVDAERISGPVWCLPGDSRITPVGRLLRVFHLDELPQLVNVVRGEMSLVGPRPERPELVETLAHEIPNYAERLRVPPGITGLAQIQLPADTSRQSVQEKTALDLHYIHTASAGQDLRIVCYTLLKVLGLLRLEPRTRQFTHQPLPQPVEKRPYRAANPGEKETVLTGDSKATNRRATSPASVPRL